MNSTWYSLVDPAQGHCKVEEGGRPNAPSRGDFCRMRRNSLAFRVRLPDPRRQIGPSFLSARFSVRVLSCGSRLVVLPFVFSTLLDHSRILFSIPENVGGSSQLPHVRKFVKSPRGGITVSLVANVSARQGLRGDVTQPEI